MAVPKHNESEERRALAERWRVLGKKLRERSPHRFEVLISVFADAALDEDEDDRPRIDSVYQIH